jgi:hypothetical protein
VPTYDLTAAFRRDLDRLTPQQRSAFRAAVAVFVADLAARQGFRRSLRVKKMRGHDRIWEMTWAADGRATFEYGPEERAGEPHIVWRRSGTHGIFDRP